MKNATHVSIVLDRSGSMESIRTDTIGGFNRFVSDQQKVPGDCTLTLVQFDDISIDTIHAATPVAQVPRLTRESYMPRGCTPLWDAIGQTIVDTGKHLRQIPEADRPDKVVFVVMTDGLENSSEHFSANRVRELIKEQTTKYKWEFVFLGANIDAYAVSDRIGIAASNVMNVASNSKGVEAMYASVSANVTKMRSCTADTMGFTTGDYEAQTKAGAKQNP